ncbi:MAG: hypothetical protein WAL39_08150 [Xanthobacteraceae bacterium]
MTGATPPNPSPATRDGREWGFVVFSQHRGEVVLSDPLDFLVAKGRQQRPLSIEYLGLSEDAVVRD